MRKQINPVLVGVANGLRALTDALTAEPLPNAIVDRLRRLEAAEKAQSNQSASRQAEAAPVG